ncbi:MAG: retropepsin-like domain-containing protein [Burkholderiaceae bacterium]|nr:retropepsin-like domain-containing protein [Burkholderiaceae bacterium]
MIPMRKEYVGHVSALLNVEGSERRFLVDSGANHNTMDSGEAKRLGLPVQLRTDSGQGHTQATVSFGVSALGKQDFCRHEPGFHQCPNQEFRRRTLRRTTGRKFHVRLSRQDRF